MTPQKVQDAIIYEKKQKTLIMSIVFRFRNCVHLYYVLEKIINMVEI